MQVLTGYFNKIDEYNRIVINHTETKFNNLSYWKWSTKLIGKPSPDFIGFRYHNIALPQDFVEGDEVLVHFTFKGCIMGEENKAIVIHKIEVIG